MNESLSPFEAQTAVITGAASGLGRALALRCAQDGMNLVLADLNHEGLEATVALLPRDLPVLLQSLDVGRAEEVEKLADLTYERFGATHYLFNNAGVVSGGSIWSAPLQDWAWMWNVNAMGVVHGVRSFVPRMLAQKDDAYIVNTSSAAGLVCPAGLGAYAASKHAVVALSECLKTELAEKGARISVSVLCPAFVNTAIVDSDKYRPDGPVAPNPEGEAVMNQVRAAAKAGRISADEVADITLRAARAKVFIILPHEKIRSAVKTRISEMLAEEVPDKGNRT